MCVCFKAPGYFLWACLCVSILRKGGIVPQKEISSKPGIFLLHWEHVDLITESWVSRVWDLSAMESQLQPSPPWGLASETSLKQAAMSAHPSTLKLTTDLDSMAQPHPDFVLSLCIPSRWCYPHLGKPKWNVTEISAAMLNLWRNSETPRPCDAKSGSRPSSVSILWSL